MVFIWNSKQFNLLFLSLLLLFWNYLDIFIIIYSDLHIHNYGI